MATYHLDIHTAHTSSGRGLPASQNLGADQSPYWIWFEVYSKPACPAMQNPFPWFRRGPPSGPRPQVAGRRCSSGVQAHQPANGKAIVTPSCRRPGLPQDEPAPALRGHSVRPFQSAPPLCHFSWRGRIRCFLPRRPTSLRLWRSCIVRFATAGEHLEPPQVCTAISRHFRTLARRFAPKAGWSAR